jgi:hypothetical protein
MEWADILATGIRPTPIFGFAWLAFAGFALTALGTVYGIVSQEKAKAQREAEVKKIEKQAKKAFQVEKVGQAEKLKAAQAVAVAEVERDSTLIKTFAIVAMIVLALFWKK